MEFLDKVFQCLPLPSIENMEHSLDSGIILLLFFAAIIASAVDAIAGGGGLLTVPSLLMAGLDPLSAIATNKLQSSFGTASAAYTFTKKGYIAWNSKPICIMIGACVVASAIGATCVKFFPISWLKVGIPFLLMLIALYFFWAEKTIRHESKPKILPTTFAVTVAPLVAFYDGIFGPGTGMFYLVGFVVLLGMDLTNANANTKVANLSSNLGALTIYIGIGAVIWEVGIAMALGSFIGGRIGAHLAIYVGGRLIRPLVIVACCAMAIKLLMSRDNPIYQLIMRTMAQ